MIRDKFSTVIKETEHLNANIFRVTSTKRTDLIPPIGTMLVDGTSGTFYIGDNVTSGGNEVLMGTEITLSAISGTSISGKTITGNTISGTNINGETATITNINGTYVLGTNISGTNISGTLLQGRTVNAGNVPNGNYTSFHEASGFMRASEAARVWDDLRFSFSQTRQGALAKPDFDPVNVGLLFPNGDPDEKTFAIGQMPHAWAIGTDVDFHMHWTQKSSGYPTWKVDYVWYNNGNASGNWTTVSGASGIFPYSSGHMGQITEIADITPSALITGVSSIMKFRIYRDDTDVAGDVLGDEFDVHYMRDSNGSDQEYSKTA